MFRIADNLAVHYFGNKSECIYESQIDRQVYDAELLAVRRDLARHWRENQIGRAHV